MRIAAAIVMFVHGVAHLPGFLVSFRLASLAELPYKTTILAGRLNLGDRGIQVMGLMWAALAIGFALASVGLLFRLPWWGAAAWAATAMSLILCVLGWPEARIGALVNLALGAWLLWGAPR
ncbi:MAG: ABC transporter permease [Acidobacteria bacterium]|nr:ABC transporter permease [Acidobacteriota bacterium]